MSLQSVLDQYGQLRARLWQNAVDAVRALERDQVAQLANEIIPQCLGVTNGAAVTPPASPLPVSPAMASLVKKHAPSEGIGNRRLILLALSDGKPRSTAEIVAEVAKTSPETKGVSLPATIARIRQLPTGPLVEQVGENDRKHPLYTLTDKGKEEVGLV